MMFAFLPTFSNFWLVNFSLKKAIILTNLNKILIRARILESLAKTEFCIKQNTA